MRPTVVITGGGSGIGRACALELARTGSHVLLVGRPASIAATQELGRDTNNIELFDADLATPELWRSSLRARIASLNARRLGAVLAASVLDPKGPESTSADFDQTFAVNVVGNLAVLECCLPDMVRTGGGRSVFFAGGGAAYGYPAFPGYALSKAATVRMVENLSLQHRATPGLDFVCLAPGAVDTPMLAKVLASGGEAKTRTQISEPVSFVREYLASDSSALNGRYVHVRDSWRQILAGAQTLEKDQFYLRRIP